MQNTVKTASESQSASVTRERQPLAPWMTEVAGRKVLELTSVSYLPANGDKKSTYGGILAGYVDPVSGQKVHFHGRNGELIAGGCPVRLFGGDAEQAEAMVGLRAGQKLALALVEGAEASVYRNDDGEVAYLAINASVLTGGYRWSPTISFEEF
jgi:hypothetical protein